MSKFKRFFWWFSGADPDLVEELPTEQSRFFGLASINFMSVVLAMLSAAIIIKMIANLPVSILLSVVWGFVILALYRFSTIGLITHRSPIRSAYFYLRILFGILLAVVVSYPFQLVIFKGSIGSAYDLTSRLQDFSLLKQRSPTVGTASIVITLLFIVIEIAPIFIVSLSNNSLYLDALERRQADMLITDMVDKSILNHDTQFIHSENDKALIEGFEVYIDYKSLMVSDINELFNSINCLYNLVYVIETFHSEAISKHLRSIGDYLKSHPEDILLLHSIRTGNSINFKVKTGWVPKFDIEDGDFVIHVPKGSISLIMVTFLIKGVIDYSISKHKELLEIDKLKLEKTLIESQIREQVANFAAKVEKAPDSIKHNLDNELVRFYSLTIGNANYRKITVTPDQALNKKIDSGKFVIVPDSNNPNIQ